MDAKQLGRNIRKFREEAGLSQQSLADKLNISFQQLQKYEYGQSRITVDRLLEISQILHTPIVELVPKTAQNASYPSYSAEHQSYAPFERVLVTEQESDLLKIFRRIQSDKVRSMITDHAKAWVAAEKELLNWNKDSTNN